MIRTASETDIGAVLALLRTVNLPIEGVHRHIDEFLISDQEGVIVGSVAMERYGRLGLLRSVAVAARLRHSGLGTALVERALEDGKRSGIDEVVLLTTTAADFFAKRFDFQECGREQYDFAFRHSEEWNLPRCSSAVVMRKLLSA